MAQSSRKKRKKRSKTKTIESAEIKIKALIFDDPNTYGELDNLIPTVLPTVAGTDQNFIIIDPSKSSPCFVCARCKQVRQPITCQKCFRNECFVEPDTEVRIRFKRAKQRVKLALKKGKKKKKKKEAERGEEAEGEEEGRAKERDGEARGCGVTAKPQKQVAL